MDTIETLLDIPLDHYVSINMRGLKDLIDAVGGIEARRRDSICHSSHTQQF
jgi:anionic cell wall polymer biosynthesis LytR-Cps2A-Psr (LCP) family protein